MIITQYFLLSDLLILVSFFQHVWKLQYIHHSICSLQKTKVIYRNIKSLIQILNSVYHRREVYSIFFLLVFFTFKIETIYCERLLYYPLQNSLRSKSILHQRATQLSS